MKDSNTDIALVRLNQRQDPILQLRILARRVLPLRRGDMERTNKYYKDECVSEHSRWDRKED